MERAYTSSFTAHLKALEQKEANTPKRSRLQEIIKLREIYKESKNNLQQTYPQIILLFSREIAYRVYDEFDETEMEYQENGDLIVRAEMPVDTWLIGYLLSFGAQVEIMEPKYLKSIIAEQAQAIYKKNKP